MRVGYGRENCPRLGAGKVEALAATSLVLGLQCARGSLMRKASRVRIVNATRRVDVDREDAVGSVSARPLSEFVALVSLNASRSSALAPHIGFDRIERRTTRGTCGDLLMGCDGRSSRRRRPDSDASSGCAFHHPARASSRMRTSLTVRVTPLRPNDFVSCGPCRRWPRAAHSASSRGAGFSLRFLGQMARRGRSAGAEERVGDIIAAPIAIRGLRQSSSLESEITGIELVSRNRRAVPSRPSRL